MKFNKTDALKFASGLLVCLAVALLFSSSFNLDLFGDDFDTWITAAQPSSALGVFTQTYNPEFYRPLELLLARLSGGSTTFYRTVTIAGHSLVVLIIMLLAYRIGTGFSIAVIAGIIFGFSNANGAAVLGNDTAGQVYSALFGLSALLALLWDERIKTVHVIAAAALLFVALLWKDSAISYYFAAAVILIWQQAPEKNKSKTASMLAIIFCGLVAYFIIRTAVGISIPAIAGHGRYSLQLGLNIPTNIALMIGAMAGPIGSTQYILRYGDFIFTGLGISATLAVIAFIGFGLRRCAKQDKGARSFVILLGILFAALLAPDFLLSRVSELYVYKPNAIFAIVFAVALAQLIDIARQGSRIKYAALIIFLIFILAANILSINHKEELMRINGAKSAALHKSILKQVPQLPDQMPVFVSQYETSIKRKYSVFFMPSVDLVGTKRAFSAMYPGSVQSFSKLDRTQMENLIHNPDQKALTVIFSYGAAQAGIR